MYRQGDVLIIPVRSIPETGLDAVSREAGRLVLAYGEATGHAHVITSKRVSLFRDMELASIFMRVSYKAIALKHDEHKTLRIPPGNYRVLRQREYSPKEVRNVAD